MSNAQCYYPSGDPALDSTPCLSGAVSFCCPKGYGCLADKLCLPPESAFGNATFLEGTCTDVTFLSPECPSHCSADQNDFPGPIEIDQCGNDPNVYCCGSCRSCSSRNGSFVTIFGISTASTIVRQTETEVLATVTVLETARTTSVVRQTILTVSTQAHSSSATVSVMARVTSTSLSSPSSTNVSLSAPASHTNITAIAIGITIPVVVIIASVLTWAFFWRRSRRTLSDEVRNHRRDETITKKLSLSNWTPRNWSHTLQELPGDTGASEIAEVPIPMPELPAIGIIPLSPLSIKSPVADGISSSKTPDIISLLSVKDLTKEFTYELPG